MIYEFVNLQRGSKFQIVRLHVVLDAHRQRDLTFAKGLVGAAVSSASASHQGLMETMKLVLAISISLLARRSANALDFSAYSITASINLFQAEEMK